MAKVNIKIEGFPFEVEAGMTILEAAKSCGFEIPSLCAFNNGECSKGDVVSVEFKNSKLQIKIKKNLALLETELDENSSQENEQEKDTSLVIK